MHKLEPLLFAALREAMTGDGANFLQLLPPGKEEKAAVLQGLFTLADRHDLAHMISPLLENVESDCALLQKFAYAERLSLYRYAQLAAVTEEVGTLLEGAALPHILLKGAVLCHYYPQPAMRTSCDLDVLVPRERVKDAIRCLETGGGYVLQLEGNHDISLQTPSGMHVELHFTLAEYEGKNATAADRLLEKVWDYATPAGKGTAAHILSDDMFYFYHIAHMAKHVLCGGCGVRPFLDLFLLQSVPHDRAARAALLEKGELLKFEETAVSLSHAWLSGGERSPLTNELADYILGAGVYGNRQNHIAVGQVKKGSRVRYLFSRVFMPYRELKLYYPSLASHRYLYPFYLLRRFCRILLCGGMGRTVREVRQTADGADGMRTFLENLGL